MSIQADLRIGNIPRRFGIFFGIVMIFIPSIAPLDQRPNLLYIITDQQRYDALRRAQEELPDYDGKIKIRTPNLDRLSRRGAYFRNAYCSCPVCAPARTVLRTGCTLERNGVQTNRLATEEFMNRSALFEKKILSLESLDQILVEDYGYISEYYGKWHIPNRLYFQRNNAAEQVVLFNHFGYEKSEFSFRDGSWSIKLADYLEYFENRGEIDPGAISPGFQIDPYTEYPYEPFRLDARFGYPTNTSLFENDVSFKSFDRSQSSVLGRYSLSREYTPTYFNAQVALKALERLAHQDKPFALTVSFHHPHPPFVAPSAFLEYYWSRRGELFVPPSINDTLQNSAYLKKKEREMLLGRGYNIPENIQEWSAAYYGLVEEIDFYVGELIEMVDDLGIADNTMIVFTSDHGEMLGAHALRSKNRFYEESVRIPLFLVFPSEIPENTVVDEPVSHLDLFSTVLDYLGAKESDRSDGKSLRPLIQRQSFNKDTDESFVVSEWDFRDPIDSATLYRTIDHMPNFMVRKGNYKLMIHKLESSPEIDMLFNLDTDPYEMNNLLGSNAATASDEVIGKAEHLKALLLEWMQRMDGEEGFYSDPAHNLHDSKGDISEIRARQSWRNSDLWVSDYTIHFGSPVWDGYGCVRNEYLYIGRTTEGYLFASFKVAGDDAGFFKLDKKSGYIQTGKHIKVKVSFFTPRVHVNSSFGAFLVITHSGKSEPLVLPLNYFASGECFDQATLSPSPINTDKPFVPVSGAASILAASFSMASPWLLLPIFLSACIRFAFML